MRDAETEFLRAFRPIGSVETAERLRGFQRVEAARSMKTVGTEPPRAAGTEPVMTVRAEPLTTVKAEPLLTVGTASVITVGTEPVMTAGTEPLMTVGAEAVMAVRTASLRTMGTEPLRTVGTEALRAVRTAPGAAPAREPFVPIRAELFEKGEQRLLFILRQTGEQILAAVMGSGLRGFFFSGVRETDVCRAPVCFVFRAGDIARGFQLRQDLAHGTGLDVKPLRKLPLGHAVRGVEDYKDVLLARPPPAGHRVADAAQGMEQLFVG